MPNVTLEVGDPLAELELEVLVDPDAEDPDRQEEELYQALTENSDELRTVAIEAVAEWLPGMVLDVAIERGSLKVYIPIGIGVAVYEADWDELKRNLQRAAGGVGRAVGRLTQRLKRGLPVTIVVSVTIGPTPPTA